MIDPLHEDLLGPGAAPVQSVEAPIRFDGKSRDQVAMSPAAGQHTDEVLRELGIVSRERKAS